MATTLYGWGEMFNLPSPSPYVMKADILLQMLGVSFDRAVADLESVDKHKAPYVWDDGELVQDSTFIRWHFERKLNIDLDEGLTSEQRGTAAALEGMLENRLTPIMICERWLIDHNFDRGPRFFFMGAPEAMREAITEGARTGVAQTMYGSGFARFSRDERMQLACAAVAATAQVLGDKPYLFGASPTAADAVGFGVLASCVTRFFDSELPDIIGEHRNLTAYLDRMRERFFAEDRWPRMG